MPAALPDSGDALSPFIRAMVDLGMRRCQPREMERSVYDAAGGSAALVRLAAAWHRRCLADPVVSHAFSHGVHPEHVDRLAAYWAEALGGPAAYTAEIGDHSHVLRLHAGNGEHGDMDQRAQQCFALALDDAGLSADSRLRRTLTGWFASMTAVMAAYPRSPDDVPDDVPLPVWSWTGPVRS